MIQITIDNIIVSKGKDLSVIDRYAKKHSIILINSISNAEDDSAIVHFHFENNAYTSVAFESRRVMREWLFNKRASYWSGYKFVSSLKE